MLYKYRIVVYFWQHCRESRSLSNFSSLHRVQYLPNCHVAKLPTLLLFDYPLSTFFCHSFIVLLLEQFTTLRNFSALVIYVSRFPKYILQLFSFFFTLHVVSFGLVYPWSIICQDFFFYMETFFVYVFIILMLCIDELAINVSSISLSEKK